MRRVQTLINYCIQILYPILMFYSFNLFYNFIEIPINGDDVLNVSISFKGQILIFERIHKVD